MIDLIREKKRTSETDADSLVANLKAEFGFTTVKTLDTTQSDTSSSQNYLLFTRGYTRLKHRDKTAISELHQ